MNSQKNNISRTQAKKITAEQSRLGQILSQRYQLLELLGVGGMGAVYKARDCQMDRFVAIKMLLQDIDEDDLMINRFMREAKAFSKINHPNVVQLIDFNTANDGLPYLVMEYVQGISLADLITRKGQIGVINSVDIFTQVCDGLSVAHEQGLVHRDLKPSNIMLIESDEEKDIVKVLDFGLAKNPYEQTESQKLTQTGEVMGSPVYMSPEQCFGGQLDARSDIYSLAVVIYESLTGKLPLLGNNVAETIARQIN